MFNLIKETADMLHIKYDFTVAAHYIRTQCEKLQDEAVKCELLTYISTIGE
jgi:hypothetical protein